MRSDGSRPRWLEWGDAGLFSPSGRSLGIDYSGDSCWAYSHSGEDPSAGLFVSGADGSHRRRVQGEAIEQWLPSGQLIMSSGWSANVLRLFDALSGRVLMMLGTRTLYSGSLDNAPSLESTFNAGVLGISCSGRVAAVRHTRVGFELDVYTRKLVGSGTASRVRVVPLRVASSRYPLSGPTWAPSGRSLLFLHADGGGDSAPVSLWRVGVDGRSLQRLTRPGKAEDGGASWSPDGREIVFNRVLYGSDGLYDNHKAWVVNANGSRPHVVAHFYDDLGVTGGVWSPDGRTIAFQYVNGHDSNVVIVNERTGAETSSVPYIGGGYAVLDWQALPGGIRMRCADRSAAPLGTAPHFTG